MFTILKKKHLKTQENIYMMLLLLHCYFL